MIKLSPHNGSLNPSVSHRKFLSPVAISTPYLSHTMHWADKVLATLFNGEVKAADLQTFEYNPATGCDCMVIYRLQTERGPYYGKAVMVR